MRRLSFSIVAAVTALAAATPALAAADIFLEIEGVDGAAPAKIEIMSWSWGIANTGANSVVSPRDTASGQASGKRQHGTVRVTASQNTQSLRESPTRASSGSGAAAASYAATGRVGAGDVDGDGRAELADAAALPEVRGLTLGVGKASPLLQRLCSGRHIPKGHISARGETYRLENAVISGCSADSPPGSAAERDSMPSRISTNVTVPRQTQGATFGERCAAGQCNDVNVAITITGQMRHTKSGHVTLLK